MRNSWFSIVSFVLAGTLAFAAVSGDPDIFETGTWVKHPGITVTPLFSGDPTMFTLAGDTLGRLNAWYPNGTRLFRVPINDQSAALSLGGNSKDYNHFVDSTPAVADINGDGDMEIFVGSGDGWVYGLDNQGNSLPGWPQFTGIAPSAGDPDGDNTYGIFGSPAVADIDSDDTFEVIVGAFSHLIYVWNAEDGSVHPGWPFNNADTFWSSPALADLNNDGDLEIIVGADSTVPQGGLLRVFSPDGDEMPGWPQLIDQVIWSSPAIGDIDDDGQLEIVVGTGIFYGDGRGEYVNAYESDGTPVTGWPVSLEDGNSSTDNRVFSSPALADVDGDGQLEIFIGSLDGYLYSISSGGSILWKSTPAGEGQNPADFAIFSSPAVGDIDGDGQFEVVVGGGWHITAFNALTGAKKSGYPIETGYPDLGGTPMFTWSSPTIADVDGDGLIELLIGNGRKDESGYPDAGGVRVYHESGSAGTSDLGATGVSNDVAPWPRFKLNNRGSGSLSDEVAGSPGADLIGSHGVSPFIASPNGDGIKDSAQISFSLSSPDTITVEIRNFSGSLVATLLNAANLSAGNHFVVWNGTLTGGATANDGMYSYRIRGDLANSVSGDLGINRTVPEVNTSWFLPEGSTVGFEGFVLIQNPNNQTISVDVTFFKQDGTTTEITETVLALARLTVPIHLHVPDTFSVSTQVDATLPIIVERAMYFNGQQSAHNSIGVTRTATEWFFPANRAFAGDEDFILIVNPNSSGTSVTASFFLEDAEPVVEAYTLSPTSRFTIPVHGVVPGRRSSVKLESTLEVAAERAFYFSSRTGGAAGVGAVSPSLTWYFAEGDTVADPFDSDTFLELTNTGGSSAAVTVNYMLEDGTVLPKGYILAARRRTTIDVAGEIGSNRRFSMVVISNVPIIAERTIFSGNDVGDTIGSPTPDYVWNLAEGFTAFGFETWVIVSNPGDQTANLTVRFLQQNGDNVLLNYTIAPKARLRVYVNDHVDPTSVSTQVTSDQPIVVERTMKFSDRKGIHQAMGVRQ